MNDNHVSQQPVPFSVFSFPFYKKKLPTSFQRIISSDWPADRWWTKMKSQNNIVWESNHFWLSFCVYSQFTGRALECNYNKSHELSINRSFAFQYSRHRPILLELDLSMIYCKNWLLFFWLTFEPAIAPIGRIIIYGYRAHFLSAMTAKNVKIQNEQITFHSYRCNFLWISSDKSSYSVANNLVETKFRNRLIFGRCCRANVLYLT